MSSELTAQQRHDARQILEHKVQGREPCMHCGGIHLRACRRVKKATYHADGSLLKVEYWKDGDWSEDEILWPEDIYDDSETDDSGQEIASE
jgi:hypothetical protein